MESCRLAPWVGTAAAAAAVAPADVLVRRELADLALPRAAVALVDAARLRAHPRPEIRMRPGKVGTRGVRGELALSELRRLSAIVFDWSSSALSGLWHSAHVLLPSASRPRMQSPQNVWWHGVKTGSFWSTCRGCMGGSP